MKSRSIRFVVTVSLVMLGAVSLPLLSVSNAFAQVSDNASAAPMTNADVVKLAKLGFDSDVIKSKIDQSPAVDFKLGINDLGNLKHAGVPQDVISDMLKRASGGGASAAGPGRSGSMSVEGMAALKMGDVTMVTKDGNVHLLGINGTISTRNAFVTVLEFQDYPGTAATVRTHDTRPSFTVYTTNNPKGSIYIASLDVNNGDQNRSLKMGNSGFGSIKNAGAPDKDNQIPYDAVQIDNSGQWRLTPTKDLKPGEYGVLHGSLYDFGVDR
ncbi:hypothetical protein [Rhodanobacter sp. C03]|uniref:hypothetical protein n=1 Tax=Rhodanobacter sp. C03 TaxID=1945858 RepID=UPI0009CC56DD|nr:hypothetical protein [Rhodanobacter sp. C03]OOG56305.1 hypothetical protein B0E48_09005 [Rhodanobacter sp. C03]